jgi:hypothetical protein
LQVDVTFYVARKANRFDWKFKGKSNFDGWSSFSSLKKQSMEGIRYTPCSDTPKLLLKTLCYDNPR